MAHAALTFSGQCLSSATNAKRKMPKWSKMKKSEFQHVVYATLETIPSVSRRRNSVHRHIFQSLQQGRQSKSVNKTSVALPTATAQLCNCATVQYWFAFGRQVLEGIVFSLFARPGAAHTGYLAVRLHALLWGFGHRVIVTIAHEITRGCKSRRPALHAESFYNRKSLVILQQDAG
jgi:hypothetical protein